MNRCLLMIGVLCGAAAGQVVDHFETRVPEPGVPPEKGVMFRYISSGMMFGDKVVRGAPYSAEAVTEHTQTLGDGNRIHRTTTAKVFRDSQGRTRREQSLDMLGPWVAAETKTITWINDPVTGDSYVLNDAEKTATKSSVVAADKLQIRRDVLPALPAPPPPGPDVAELGVGSTVMFAKRAAPGAPPDSKTESLGSQVIEGVRVDGTRTTTVIPAGQIGNDRPIEIVTETWFSPDLQTTVLSKRLDPIGGDTIFKLTNIIRDEPNHTLFEIPPGYTVKDAPDPVRVFHKQ
jgi:hypothetical protein